MYIESISLYIYLSLSIYIYIYIHIDMYSLFYGTPSGPALFHKNGAPQTATRSIRRHLNGY